MNKTIKTFLTFVSLVSVTSCVNGSNGPSEVNYLSFISKLETTPYVHHAYANAELYITYPSIASSSHMRFEYSFNYTDNCYKMIRVVNMDNGQSMSDPEQLLQYSGWDTYIDDNCLKKTVPQGAKYFLDDYHYYLEKTYLIDLQVEGFDPHQETYYYIYDGNGNITSCELINSNDRSRTIDVTYRD